MSFPKIILQDSFDYQHDQILSKIVDDPAILSKTASSNVVAQWGDIEPKKNHSLVHLIALGSTEAYGPNRNADGFKVAFCRSSHPTFITHGSLFRDHKNKDHSKKDGTIEKTAFNEDMKRVELLVAANHEKCADWLEKLEKGQKVAFSMGLDCDHDICSCCGNKAKTRKDYCQCMKKSAGQILPDGRKVFVDNPSGRWNDISYVGRGADMIAMDLRKVASEGSSVMTGADLADLMFLSYGTPKSAKEEMVQKLSNIEKKIQAMGVKSPQRKAIDGAKICKKATDLFAFIDSPTRIFSELAGLNAVLSFKDFFKVALGGQYSNFENEINDAAKYVHRCFSIIEQNESSAQKVASSESYRCTKATSSFLPADARNQIIADFSVNLASGRVTKEACLGMDVEHESVEGLPSSKALYLLEEYAAYKIAALEAINVSNEETLFNVMLQ
jgi:hypothetical protein